MSALLREKAPFSSYGALRAMLRHRQAVMLTVVSCVGVRRVVGDALQRHLGWHLSSHISKLDWERRRRAGVSHRSAQEVRRHRQLLLLD